MRTEKNLPQVDSQVTMRVAGAADDARVARLAALDSSRVPAGEILVAEVDGELQAAVAVQNGAAIADPFRPTGNVVSLLRERASQMRAESGTARRGHGFGFRLARAA